MIVSKVKQIYSYELQTKFKKRFGVQEMDYRYREFLDEICDDGLYVRDFPKNKAKLRITFLPFLICILILCVVSLFKYLFTGNYYFGEKNLIIRKMIAWDKYCKFNIIS